MSNKHRGKVLGDAITQTLPLPAGGVKLETFIPWTLVKRGIEARVVPPPGATVAFTRKDAPSRDDGAGYGGGAPVSPLVRALGLAHYWQRLLDDSKAATVKELALREGTDASLTHRILRLTQLAPDVIETLLASPKLGAEPVLSRRWPQDWSAQRALLAEIGAER